MSDCVGRTSGSTVVGAARSGIAAAELLPAAARA